MSDLLCRGSCIPTGAEAMPDTTTVVVAIYVHPY